MSRDPIYDIMKENSKRRFDANRARFAQEAVEQDDGGWTKHTKWHWSRTLDGDRLDYWPSRKRIQFRKRIWRGDVFALIAKHSTQPNQDTEE